MRRARETGGRAAVPDQRAVCRQTLGGGGCCGGDDDGDGVRGCREATSHRRLRMAAGRVARVFAHVRQEGPADAARVLLPSRDGRGEKGGGEPQALRQEVPADQEAQVQPASVRRARVVRGRAEEETADRGDGGRRVRAERARAKRVCLLSRHAVRQTCRVSDPVQRKLFRNLPTEVNVVIIYLLLLLLLMLLLLLFRHRFDKRF